MFKIPRIKSSQDKAKFIFGTLVGGAIISVVAQKYPEYNPAVYISNMMSKG